MEKNTYITVFGFIVFVVDETLDLYHEWDLFEKQGHAREEELSERKEIFLDCLIDCGRLIVPSEEEVIPDSMSTYLSFDLIPTPEEIESIKVIFGDNYKNLTVRDIELLASGYRQDVFIKAGWTQDVYSKWLLDRSISLSDKKMTIFRSIVDKQRQQHINTFGFTMQGVNGGSETPWKSYTYTIGLSAKVGYELVIVNGGSQGPNLLSRFANEAIAGTIALDSVVECDEFRIADNPARVTIQSISLDSYTAKGCMGKVGKVTDIKQIFLADKNNILPSEEGYDVGYVQTLSEDDV